MATRPEHVADASDPGGPFVEIDRRQFATLLGASVALAGASGCSPRPAPVGEIVPYVRPPQQLTPGNPLTFATAICLGNAGIGLLARSREGRPIKVEGNPAHPGSQGATDLFSQASLLDLYDPDRSAEVMHRGAPASWDEAFAALQGALARQRKSGGVGLRLLTGAIASPTLAAQVHALLRAFPRGKWARHEAFDQSAVKEGVRRAFGRPIQPVYDLSKADVILALDADFLSCDPGTVRYQREFADGRRVRASGAGGVTPDAMNRLYAVESMLTATGASADHRLPLRPSQIEAFARALASELGVTDAPLAGTLAEDARAWVKPVADDLRGRRGRSVVLVGDGQPASLHALGHALNSALGNIGTTVRFIEPLDHPGGEQSIDLAGLVAELAGGQVELLLVFGCNPVFTAPVDLDFAAAIQKAKLSFHLGLYRDETGAACEWHIPEAHPLEAWGDARGYDGSVALQQPLVEPLRAGRSGIEFLAALVNGSGRAGREVVRDHWRAVLGEQAEKAEFDNFWTKVVQRGVVPHDPPVPNGLTLRKDWAKDAGAAAPAAGGVEIQFRLDPTLYDGRFANNAWLQELPKPVTKLTWGNAALMSPATAARLGINERRVLQGGQHGGEETDVVELRYRGRTVEAPAWVVPGHADDAVTVYVGHGRTHAGRIGTGVGFNAYALRTSDAPAFGSGLEVAKTGQRETLAATQAHHRMEGRDPVQRATAAVFARDPHSLPDKLHERLEKADVTALPPRGDSPAPPGALRDRRLVPLTLYPEVPYPDRRWGMVIDLSVCTGCSACVVACQAENNIPVVGKEQVLRGREMHWLRVDPFEAEGRNYFQPVPCMHCEKAPCEVVCPTGATEHSAEGLNEMVYNRCFGTRFCSNNCPYKVRRFNFLAYADFATESLKLLHNPEVTVRSRGVMEKCSYCVQRIRNVEIVAERESRTIRDGEVKTACQQACPSSAIVFGDLNDRGSAVRRWSEEPQNYGLLAELNTQPRTTYLAAIRNPNPDMPGGA